MDPTIIAAGISGLANIGGGFMSAAGAANANAANAAINQQNIAAAQQQWNQQQTFQNNVNVANWAYQDKVNQENFDFAREQTDRSEAFAQQQMSFQERMSSTAYQRAMADMKAAGLNPMLAYQQGGATTPSGAMGTAQNASAQSVSGSGTAAAAPRANIPMQNTADEFGRAIGRAATSAVDTYRMGQDAELKRSQTGVSDATKGLVENQSQHEGQKMEKTIQETYTEKERNKLVEAQRGLVRAQSAASYADAQRSLVDAAYRAGQKKEADRLGYNQGPGTGERILRSVGTYPDGGIKPPWEP